MEHNKNTVAAINHQRAIRIKFHDHSWYFLSIAQKNWTLSRVVAVAVEERRPLWIGLNTVRVNLRTVHRDILY